MIDKEKVIQAVELFLEGIGEDKDRQGLRETPERIARMCKEILCGTDEEVKTHLAKRFEAGASEIVLEKDITFYSLCEHHLLPFFGKAHIAYVPNGEVVGLSKLARTVDGFAKRLQIQERLTGQIATAIMENLAPKGVMVIMEAEHLCMSMRGVQKPGTKTITISTKGVFAENEELQNKVLNMVG